MTMRDADQEDLSRFLTELQTETDRGLALVAASVLDDKLRGVLTAFFAENSAASRLLDSGNAPLGTFSSRADACHALGLIDDFEHQEITLVRKVRNEFAHGLHGTRFQTEPIRGFCSSLKSNLPEDAGHPTTDARFRFINSVVSLVSRLYYRSEWVAKERRAAKEWVSPDQVRWRSFKDEKPPEGAPVLGIFKKGADPGSA
jgi:DNA-binding MltR family transcriptional regulator